MLLIDDLYKAYGDIAALAGCSFRVVPGRLLGFLGPNGAGKTTTMRAVFGLVTPDRGRVLWGGKPVGVDDRLRFGYMPESRGLYPKMKAADQLGYLGRLHGMTGPDARTAALAWLERLGLADRAADAVEKLSHGNQQRVQLAAALIHQPELLVLDEPFSGLDPIGVETMAGVLRERAAAGAAVLFSSHQLDLVEDLCDDVAIIHQGKVVKAGSVVEIKDASPVRHLEFEFSEPGYRLPESLEGVISSQTEGNRHRLLVRSDVDVKAVLADALAAGQIRRFIYTPPSLSEIFLEAVG
ncbi:MAG TPA: ATP-binding cassette domain-containing protein [Acidimicrobiia bacterium]|nr:ATP-binding cassette domain-containing protein [Acidimicrobiia bacterium]